MLTHSSKAVPLLTPLRRIAHRARVLYDNSFLFQAVIGSLPWWFVVAVLYAWLVVLS